MNLKLPIPLRHAIKTSIKASKFWQDNYILLREFKKFRRIAVLSVVFTIAAAVFEGLTLGLLLSFIQSLTSPEGAAVTKWDLDYLAGWSLVQDLKILLMTIPKVISGFGAY